MKVNTDGVLLGAAATLSVEDRRVLDAGTGTGTIAMMLAQRYSSMSVSDVEIKGIDIDEPSAAEAAINFASCRWASFLQVEKCSLSDYEPSAELDLIVSNPPFFEASLLPPESRRGLARHAAGEAMSSYDLIDFARTYLSEPGRLSLILPADRERDVVRYSVSCGLHPFRILRIRTTPKKNCSRIIVELSRNMNVELLEETLTIQDVHHFPQNKNGYTPEYLDLTGEFYL